MYTSGINLFLPSLPTDLGDGDKLTVFVAIQILQEYVTKMTRVIAVYDVTTAAGQLVAVYLSGGVLHARLANATDNTKPAVGFCPRGGVTSGSSGEIVTYGMNEYCSGLTIGSQYYLDTTNGLMTVTKPVGAGKIVQPLGFAISATTLFFTPNNNWTQL